MLAQINTFVVMGLGDRGDRDIIIGSAKQDLSKMEIEIQTLDQGDAIISTIGIPFPVSTRITGSRTTWPGSTRKRRRTSARGCRLGFHNLF